MAKENQTRGIRNNNPLNIRLGSNWKGMRPEQTDKSFCQFVSMAYGLRAGIRLILNYITGWNGRRKKICTVTAIIEKWAPPSENNTRNYIRFVCDHSGLNAYQVLSRTDKNEIFFLIKAMCQIESLYILDRDTFDSAWSLL